MKKKAILAPEVVKLILAAIGIALLLLLFWAIVGIFTQNAKIEQAKSTLADLDSSINLLQEGQPQDYSIFSPTGWSLFTLEAGNKMKDCNSNFCLCICKSLSCTGEYACKETKRFVLLQDSEGKAKRSINIESAPQRYTLTLSLSIKIYSYNIIGYPSEDAWKTGGLTGNLGWVKAPVPFNFFLFKDNKWAWSPTGAEGSWKSLSEYTIPSSNWGMSSLDRIEGRTSGEATQKFAQVLNEIGTSETEGKKLLEENGAKLSEGIIIMKEIAEEAK